MDMAEAPVDDAGRVAGRGRGCQSGAGAAAGDGYARREPGSRHHLGSQGFAASGIDQDAAEDLDLAVRLADDQHFA